MRKVSEEESVLKLLWVKSLGSGLRQKDASKNEREGLPDGC